METVFPWHDEAPLGLLRRCGGFYQCPKDPDGKRLGPLVGYAGRDGQGRQFVGEVYVNVAKAEEHGPVLKHFAQDIGRFYDDHTPRFTGFCGAPEGGKALAAVLASLVPSGSRYIFPEKKIIVVASATSREISTLVFDRHEPEADTSWWIVEDVCNNFSTTTKLVELIESRGASVRAIVCFLNRSPEVDKSYEVRPGLILPVFALVRQPIRQWQQDDPAVSADIQAGNVVWKPKNDWAKLEAAMSQ